MSPIYTGVISQILTSVMPALLSLVGLLLTLVVAVWGAYQLYAHFSGMSSSQVTYKIGRIFGSHIRDREYRRYRASRQRRERRREFDRRYRSGK